MKKRRQCTLNRSRSPRNSPRSPHGREFESFRVKTYSSHDLKRRHLQHASPKLQKKSAEYNDVSRLKRDAFGSLESLFDVKKPLNLPEGHSFALEYHREGYVVPPFETGNSRKQTTFVGSPTSQTGAKLEPHILEQTYGTSDHSLKNKPVETVKLENREIKQDPVRSEGSPYKSMADNETEVTEEAAENPTEDAAENPTEDVAENPTEDVAESPPEVVPEKEDATDRESEIEEFASMEVVANTEEAVDDQTTTEEIPDGKGSVSGDKGAEASLGELQGQPPPHPLPPDVGQGVPVKPGGRRESALSTSPLTDTAVMKEMQEADERCSIIAREIEQLKQEIAELTNKKDLTEEDTIAIQEKQDDVMSKLAEFEEMTRKLQRLLGLTDPSSYTFAKMFDMLPYPHTKRDGPIAEEEEPGDVDREKESKSGMFEKGDMAYDGKKGTKELTPDDRFDLPQVEYPEDKLPRVIICGYTEDEIPKIVVADSERKGKKRCFQNLTGKLTESLTMQERLVQENAQLEGGKYKLEEALLEKDSAVESLQRKVCGLQAEMRIVVKENTELSRQLACLNQRVTSPCCYTCPDGTSSPTSSPAPVPYSYTSSLQQDDDYCRCKCCLQTQFGSTFSPITNTVCVNPDSYKSVRSSDSPRLAGGASRTGGCGLISSASSQVGDMCCRSPAAVKPPCPGPPPRGACPAELENKIAIYGNNTKQLEQQLGSMECEVRNMQIELANVQRERQQLEQQRKLLKCTGPCAPCGCCPPPPGNLPPNMATYVPPSPIIPPPMSAPVPLSKVSEQFLDRPDYQTIQWQNSVGRNDGLIDHCRTCPVNVYDSQDRGRS